MNDAIEKQQLRAEAASLLATAREQASNIKKVLADMRGNNPQLAALAQQASDVVSQISSAMNSSTLSASEIAMLAMSISSAPDTSALAAEATSEKAAANVEATLSSASAALRDEVSNLSDDMFKRGLFDSYLKFSSPEDEAAYRRRETEDQKYIDDQLKLHTGEGNLNASGRMHRSMLDAHAHGAGDSPEFMKRWEALAEKTKQERAAMKAAGKSTDEFDRNLKGDVTAFLKQKGLSQEEIDKALAKSDSPLDAVRPYLSDDNASQSLKKEVVTGDKAADMTASTLHTTDKDKPLAIDLSQMDAKLEAAGLPTSAAPDNTTGHGLSAQRNTARNTQGIAG